MDNSNLVLSVRLLLREVNSGRVLRIVTPDGAGHYTVLCDINDEKSWPFVETTDRIRERLSVNEPEETRLVVELDDPYSPLSLPARKNDDSAQLERDWKLIQPLVTGVTAYRVMLPDYRNHILNSCAALHGTTRQKLTRALKRYWKRGLTLDALRDDRHKCGHRGLPRTYTNKKPGRPRKDGHTGVPLTVAVRKLLNIAADYYLAAPKKRSMQDALDRIAEHFGEVHKVDSNGATVYVGISRADLPTIRQLRHQITQRSFVEVQKAKFGARDFELYKRQFTGRADQHVTGPGDEFVVDATIADVYLVSQFDRTLIVGRPTVYFVVDAFSRLIVGMYVGFEPPSWIAALVTLTNVVAPKVAWCAQYGIEITENQWPSHHLSSVLLGDKGEMISSDSGRLVDKNLVHLDNPSAWRPDLKALVETRFNMIKAKFSAFAPGFVEKDFGERGRRDYRLDSALDINDFTRILIWAVLQYNAAPIASYPTSPEMIAEGRAPTPLNLWKFGSAARSGVLRTVSIDEVRRSALPRVPASVTHQGIKFRGAFYECDTALRDDWFDKARQGRWNVSIAFDPRDSGAIWWCDGLAFEACRPRRTNPMNMKLHNMTLAERAGLENLDASNSEGEQDQHLRLRMLANQATDTIVKNAIAQKKEAMESAGIRKLSTSDIRDANSFERSAERLGVAGPGSDLAAQAEEIKPPRELPPALTGQAALNLSDASNITTRALSLSTRFNLP